MNLLSTKYLGLELENPLIAAASPLTGDITAISRLDVAGAAAVVLPSLFEEQIENSDSLLPWQSSFTPSPAADSYVPDLESYNTGPDGYLRYVELVKKTIRKPVIASLNGSSLGGWIRFARLIEQAGADALELNILFIATDPNVTSQDVEDRYLEITEGVRAAVSIPLAIKVGPYFTAPAHFAQRIAQAGGEALVLFNRYLAPEFDIDKLDIHPQLELSSEAELRLPLRWIAILRDQVDISLAATCGIHQGTDVAKALLAGADVVMCASTLLKHGPEQITRMLSDLKSWMQEKQFDSVDAFRGLLARNRMKGNSALERANYLRALSSFTDDFRSY